jgi:hypothetical protein
MYASIRSGVDLERVEQAQHVPDQLRLLVARRRRLAAAEAAQVGADDVVAGRQRRDQVAELVPVLRPAEEHQQRLAGAGPHHVHAQAVHVDVSVLDAEQ